ncbi:MAG: sarcinarray family MAST domain-containing protein [Methanocellales archaeon]
MTKTKVVIIIGFLMLTLSTSVQAFEGTLAKGVVYFNDQRATVDNVTLRIGEPFLVRAEISTKEKVHISLKLSVSGFREKEKQPFEIIEGVSALNQWYDELNVPKGTNLTFIWKLKATEAWAGGTAPLNIDFTIHPSKGGDSETIGFTIVNAYISKEYYEGYEGTTPTPSLSPVKTTPGFEFALLVFSCISAFAIARRIG